MHVSSSIITASNFEFRYLRRVCHIYSSTVQVRTTALYIRKQYVTCVLPIASGIENRSSYLALLFLLQKTYRCLVREHKCNDFAAVIVRLICIILNELCELASMRCCTLIHVNGSVCLILYIRVI